MFAERHTPRHRAPSRRARLAGRGLALVAVVTGVLAVAPAAQASQQLVCNGGGGVTIDRQLDGTYKWVMTGFATCNNPQGDPVRTAALTGLGESANLGICSDDLLVDAFSMNVAVTFTSFSPLSGVQSSVQHQVWSLPATTFPVVTPFVVSSQEGGLLGAGELSTHIALKCPPAGQPSMQVAWVQIG
jgi:hypothetical protein